MEYFPTVQLPHEGLEAPWPVAPAFDPVPGVQMEQPELLAAENFPAVQIRNPVAPVEDAKVPVPSVHFPVAEPTTPVQVVPPVTGS